jgi:hypothetical protein
MAKTVPARFFNRCSLLLLRLIGSAAFLNSQMLSLSFYS